MTPQFSARRAAEEFARAIDGPSRTALADRDADLTRTVALLRSHPQPSPRPEFVAGLRDRLMVAADDVLLPIAGGARDTTPIRRSLTWRERHIGAAAAALVLVGGTAGIAAAAQGSLPGDTLYPIKRGMEHIEVTMTTNDAARGKELLSQASTRLDEVRALADRHDSSTSVSLMNDTLKDFTATANKGSDLLFTTYQGKGNGTDIAEVRSFTVDNMSTLQSLAKVTPPTVANAFSQAGEVLADIDQQARVLCVACFDAPAVDLPQSLVNLASASSLETLVALPAQQAHKDAQLAAAAQDEASAAEDAASDLASEGVTTPSGAPSPTGIASTPADALGKGLPKLSEHPVTDLLGQLTSAKLPVVSNLTQALQGITGPLGQTIEGMLKPTPSTPAK